MKTKLKHRAGTKYRNYKKTKDTRFPKEQQKMQTCLNHIEQYNDE